MQTILKPGWCCEEQGQASSLFSFSACSLLLLFLLQPSSLGLPARPTNGTFESDLVDWKMQLNHNTFKQYLKTWPRICFIFWHLARIPHAEKITNPSIRLERLKVENMVKEKSKNGFHSCCEPHLKQCHPEKQTCYSPAVNSSYPPPSGPFSHWGINAHLNAFPLEQHSFTKP